MFDTKTRTIVIVGAQWGDEGKGKLVDVLAARADWVVRYQGGANAGHTVHVGDESTVLHQVPSGIMHPGVRCAIGNGVVLDPESVFEEVDALVANGVDVEGRLYLSDRAHLVMPYHKLVERGIDHANHNLLGFGSSNRADAAFTLAALEKIAPRLLAIAEDVGLAVHRAQKQGAAILLEGAQGSLLDVDHGTYPFVTSSSTTAGGAAIGVGIGPRCIDAVIGVVKAYTTRVGAGPLPTEFDAAMSERVRQLGNEFGATTGRPRRCGWFDAVVVRYAVRINGLTGLAVTKLDVLDTLEKIGLCTGYRIAGEVVDEFPGDIADLEGIEPVYEWFDGWKSSTSAARTLSALPKQARVYLDRMQELVECPAQYVSVGTRRDQIIGL